MIGGCGPDPYREAIRRQTSKFEELADLLAEVKDARSMSDAEATIADRMDEFQRAANRVGKLPQPDPERAQSYEEEFGPKLKAAFERYAAECRRIRALPGGEAFLDRIGKRDAGTGP